MLRTRISLVSFGTMHSNYLYAGALSLSLSLSLTDTLLCLGSSTSWRLSRGKRRH